MTEHQPTTSSGIYLIRCIPSGKVYVGSAVRFASRWYEHRWDLAKGTHHSVLLQRAWNKYGAEAFEFVILENCPRDQLRCREQHYMDTLKSYEPAQGFNINRDAKTRLGMPTSEAAKAKISAFQKGKIVSQETRARMSAAFRGRKYSEEYKEQRRNQKHSEETKAKLSAIAKSRKPTRLGAKLTDETKAKIAAKARGRVTSEETKAKLSAALQGRVFSAEHRAGITASLQARAARLKREKSKGSQLKMSFLEESEEP